MAPMLMSKALAPEQTNFKSESLPTVTCSDCGADTPEESRFCYKCGHQIISMNKCGNCSTELPADAIFCSHCGDELSQSLVCSDCKQKLPHGTKYCFSCGKNIKE